MTIPLVLSYVHPFFGFKMLLFCLIWWSVRAWGLLTPQLPLSVCD
jgi:hypothetical protein